MSFLRREIPLGITLVIGVVTVFAFFFNVSQASQAVSIFTSWGTLVAAFAVCLGVTTTMLSNFRAVRKKAQGWYLNLWLVIVAIIFLATGLTLGPSNRNYIWLFNAIIPQGNTAITSLVGAATISAVVRGFRTKSIESSLLAIPALILIVWNTPLIDAIWEGFGIASSWLLNVPSTGGNRGFIIGVAIGAISLALRTLIGRERGYLGRE